MALVMMMTGEIETDFTLTILCAKQPYISYICWTDSLDTPRKIA